MSIVTRLVGGVGRVLRRFFENHISPSGRAYRARVKQEGAVFDGATGFDTSGIQVLKNLTLVGDNPRRGTIHIAAPPEEFTASLKLIDIDLAKTTFVDLGSGKGRALLLAAERPFKRIVGVEYAKELHDAATSNAAKLAARKPKAPKIETLNIDAATYDFPDGPLVIFLYNPFDGVLMAEVAQRALASWHANPRPVRILYMIPVFADVWTDAGWRLIDKGEVANLYAPPEG